MLLMRYGTESKEYTRLKGTDNGMSDSKYLGKSGIFMVVLKMDSRDQKSVYFSASS